MKLTNKNLLPLWYTFNNLKIWSADHTMTPDILVAMVFNDKRLNNMNKAFNLSIDIVLMFRGFYAWISTLWRIFFLKNVLLVLTFMQCEIHWYWNWVHVQFIIWHDYFLFFLMWFASPTPFTKTFLYIKWSKHRIPRFFNPCLPYLESLNTFIAVHFQPQLYFVHP